MKDIKMYQIVCVTNSKLEQIKDHTCKDKEPQILSQLVARKIPSNKTSSNKPNQIKPAIWQFTILFNGIQQAGSCLIIARVQQHEILQKIHQGHTGIEKC